METFSSTVTCYPVNLNGTVPYTPPNPPTSPNGSLGGTYTLADGTVLTMTYTSTPGASVQFTITVGTQPYSFNGAYNSGTNEIVGRVEPCPSPQEVDDNWTASGQ